MQRFSAEASQLSEKIDQQHNKALVLNPQAQPAIHLQGENQGENLTLTTDQLYYLAAADNYVQVFYADQAQVKNRMLRTTLKKMEDALAAHPQFFRCHRTYLVNLDKVLQVSGNAQGYRLQLMDQQETIPVSRNLNDVIQKRMAATT